MKRVQKQTVDRAAVQGKAAAGKRSHHLDRTKRSTEEDYQHENQYQTRSEDSKAGRGRKRSGNRSIRHGGRKVQGGNVFATTRSRSESAGNFGRETPAQSDQSD